MSTSQEVIQKLKIKMFADGADIAAISELNKDSRVSGFTTNPTLMAKSGITDYKSFALEVAEIVSPKPISLEVFADDINEMRRQALLIAQIPGNVYVKIPITNTLGESCLPLVRELSSEGVRVNITAIFTDQQVEETITAVTGGAAAVVSVFAGRIADAGVDPVPAMRKYAGWTKDYPEIELLWASPREILNLIQADNAGCDIITMTPDLWAKTSGLGKSLEQFSLETVQMFFNDSTKSGFSL